ncbi:MAG: hypothetical protein CM15mP59_4010 [Flavobacteriaceae bacterium]|nr:MAG: hypothetical protein CM15mP59_4010 [Flavobacteriaceae bacterium]
MSLEAVLLVVILGVVLLMFFFETEIHRDLIRFYCN